MMEYVKAEAETIVFEDGDLFTAEMQAVPIGARTTVMETMVATMATMKALGTIKEC